ncbi:MAG TPA: tripartite tricarboxylate transporter substrate binding protein [Acetobacteraceae bacterium]|nr:tripartite tricarboxylate transporter substrate binding protein [Acetobacteraceae bacterium]
MGLLARPARAASWTPTRPIELVVPSAAGGGLDTTARVLQRMLHELKLTDQAVNVINKPGGSGAIGILYCNQHKGDGHYVCTQSPGLLTNELVGTSTIGLKDVTPVAQLVDEEIIFTVGVDSPFKSGKELAAKLGSNPESVSIAMSSAPGGHSHIAAALVAKAAGGEPRKLKTVFFNGGGECATALMGGHVMVTVTPASSILGPLAAGKVQVIAQAGAKRLPGVLSDVPTWQEQGIDVVFSAWRALTGPIGMTAAQLAWWDPVLAQLTRSDDWTKYVQQNEWSADYRDSADTKRFFTSERERLASIISELGLARKSPA